MSLFPFISQMKMFLPSLCIVFVFRPSPLPFLIFKSYPLFRPRQFFFVIVSRELKSFSSSLPPTLQFHRYLRSLLSKHRKKCFVSSFLLSRSCYITITKEAVLSLRMRTIKGMISLIKEMLLVTHWKKRNLQLFSIELPLILKT